MTFELNSTIQTADANAVIAVLESQLKTRARSVVRASDSIIAKKLDTTWGSGHRNDITTFEVRTNGRQAITVARVKYTPSGFFWICELFLMFTAIGWVFPLLYYFYQKTTVRKAIEEVLLRVKGECEFRSTGPDTLPFKSPPNNAPSQSPHVISWPPPANDTPIQPSTTPDTIASFPQSNDAAVHPDAGPDTAAALQHQDTPPVQRTISQELPPARYEQPPTRSNPTLLVMLGFLGAIALVSTVGWFRTWHTAPAAETTGRPIAVEAKEDHPAVPMQSNQTPEVPQSPELQPIPAVEQSPEPSTGTNEPVAVAPPGSPADQIKSVLDVWVQSMRSGDLNAQMTCYAPMLERYFRSTNVDEPTLRKSKAAWMAKWTSATFDLSEITFHELGPDRFEVEFHKEWDATGSSHFTGASRNVLIFQRIDDAWKIVSEQEPQVYRVSKVPNETSQTPSSPSPTIDANT